MRVLDEEGRPSFEYCRKIMISGYESSFVYDDLASQLREAHARTEPFALINGVNIALYTRGFTQDQVKALCTHAPRYEENAIELVGAISRAFQRHASNPLLLLSNKDLWIGARSLDLLHEAECHVPSDLSDWVELSAHAAYLQEPPLLHWGTTTRVVGRHRKFRNLEPDNNVCAGPITFLEDIEYICSHRADKQGTLLNWKL